MAVSANRSRARTLRQISMLAVISPSGRHGTFACGGYILGQTSNLPAANLGSPSSNNEPPPRPGPAHLRGCSSPRPEVLEAYRFGSHAQGVAQPHSDIDVAVYIDESRVEESAFGYRAHLTTVLIGALHDNDMDLLILNHAPPGAATMCSATAYVSCPVI